jgi:3-hydroxymyristoyl/3-hydroxydecanoyl-(acyl carrier protein) dehydratase
MKTSGLCPEQSGGMGSITPKAGRKATGLHPEKSEGQERDGEDNVFPDTSAEKQAPGPMSGGYAAEFVFPPDFVGFAGHFPGNPVLPGIAQIMAVLHTCGPGLRLHAVKDCKFLRPVIPDERLSITAKQRGDAGGVGIAIDAVLRVGQERCASMRLLLERLP